MARHPGSSNFSLVDRELTRDPDSVRTLRSIEALTHVERTLRFCQNYFKHKLDNLDDDVPASYNGVDLIVTALNEEYVDMTCQFYAPCSAQQVFDHWRIGEHRKEWSVFLRETRHIETYDRQTSLHMEEFQVLGLSRFALWFLRRISPLPDGSFLSVEAIMSEPSIPHNTGDLAHLCVHIQPHTDGVGCVFRILTHLPTSFVGLSVIPVRLRRIFVEHGVRACFTRFLRVVTGKQRPVPAARTLPVPTMLRIPHYQKVSAARGDRINLDADALAAHLKEQTEIEQVGLQFASLNFGSGNCASAFSRIFQLRGA